MTYVNIDAKTLSTSLDRVVSAADKKTALPILGCVVFRPVNDDTMTITANNLEIAITLTIPGTCSQPLAINAAELRGALKSADDRVTIDANGITTETMQSRFYVKADASTSPVLPKTTSPFVDAAVLTMESLESTAYRVFHAADVPDRWGGGRKRLQCVNLRCENGMLVAESSDGFRIARAFTSADGSFRALVPTKALTALKKAKPAGPIAVALSGNEIIRFTWSDGSMIARTEDHTSFPCLDNVIPRDCESSFTIDAPALQKMASGLKSATKHTTYDKIYLDLPNANGSLPVLVRNSAKDDPIANTSVPLIEHAPTLSIHPVIAFNRGYIEDAAKHAGKTPITLGFNGPSAPVKITADDGYLCVIMPMV